MSELSQKQSKNDEQTVETLIAKKVSDTMQMINNLNFGGNCMDLIGGGYSEVDNIVADRAKNALLKNYEELLLNVPEALEWVVANPVKKNWDAVRDIRFIEEWAVECDNTKYENMEFREEFDATFTVEVENSREFLESCDLTSFKKWCTETIGKDGEWYEEGGLTDCNGDNMFLAAEFWGGLDDDN